MQTKGVLCCSSGSSGAGKRNRDEGTFRKNMITTRFLYRPQQEALRPGEEKRKRVFLPSQNPSLRIMIRNDELIEHARYVDHYYGTPRKYVEDKMAAGKDVIP